MRRNFWLRHNLLENRYVDEGDWPRLLDPSEVGLIPEVVERLLTESSRGRNGLLRSLARLVSTPHGAAALARADLLDRLVDALAAEPLTAAYLSPSLRPNPLWYRDILFEVGPAAGPPLRRLLAGPVLDVLDVPSSQWHRQRPGLFARWLGTATGSDEPWPLGAKLVALSVLERCAGAADQVLLASLAEAVAEPIAVRQAAARSLANLRAGQPGGPDGCTGRRELDQLLRGTGGWLAELQAYASAGLMEALCDGLGQGGSQVRAARVEALIVVSRELGPRLWLQERANVARLADALLAVQDAFGNGPGERYWLAELQALVLHGVALPAEVSRRLVLGLHWDPHARDVLLRRLEPYLTAADGPLLHEVARNAHNTEDVRRRALQGWFRLDPEAATPAVRAGVLAGLVPLPAALRDRADHLDWLLAALGAHGARVAPLLVDCGPAAVAPLAALVRDAPEGAVRTAAEQALGRLCAPALAEALAWRAAQARGLSRVDEPARSAERGLSRDG